MNSAQKAFYEMCTRNPFVRDAVWSGAGPFTFWWDNTQWSVTPEQIRYVLARLALEGNSNDRTTHAT